MTVTRRDTLGRIISPRRGGYISTITPPPPPGEWITQAVCADMNPAEADRIFFPLTRKGDQGTRTRMLTSKARQICRECPVINPCGEYALRNHILHGVWGGMSEDQREHILRTGGRPAS